MHWIVQTLCLLKLRQESDASFSQLQAVSSVSLKVVPPTDKAKATSASPQKAPQATGATPKKSNSFAPKVSEPSTTVRGTLPHRSPRQLLHHHLTPPPKYLAMP
jgi:hypothetical protein